MGRLHDSTLQYHFRALLVQTRYYMKFYNFKTLFCVKLIVFYIISHCLRKILRRQILELVVSSINCMCYIAEYRLWLWSIWKLWRCRRNHFENFKILSHSFCRETGGTVQNPSQDIWESNPILFECKAAVLMIRSYVMSHEGQWAAPDK